MATTQSSQSFVRALKATSDPLPDGLYKIEIARHAWDDASFYIPSKAELIVDWILIKFSKERSKDPSTSPLLDLRYWKLLSDIISTHDIALTTHQDRPFKTWLLTLLNHIPFSPILVSFLGLIGNLELEARRQLTLIVGPCFRVIWPLGTQKLTTEALLECFGAFLGVMKACESDEDLTRIGLLVTASYRNSLGNSSNKKKLHAVFLQSHLQPWLEHAAVESPLACYQTILENTYSAGAETLFSVDILRQTHAHKSDNLLFEALRRVSITSSTVVLRGLPHLFVSFIQYIKKYRATLFSQGSNQLFGAATEELHTCGMRFFVSCQPLLDENVDEELTWPTRVALITLVDQEYLFNRKQPDAELALTRNTELALATLSTSRTDKGNMTTYAIECLSALARIDFDLILAVIPRLLPRLLLIFQTSQPLIAFLDVLLNYHTKTRTMNTYITSLFDALSSSHLTACPGGMRRAYQISLSGPLLHAVHLGHLSNSMQTFLTSGQTPDAVNFVIQIMRERWEQFHNAERQHGIADGDSSHRRRKLDTPSDEVLGPEGLAITFTLSARLASVVLTSLPLQSVPESTQQEIGLLLTDLHTSLLSPVLNKTFKTIRKKDISDAWASQVVAAAVLRLRYALEVSQMFPLKAPHDPRLFTKMLDALQDEELLPELILEIFRALLKALALGDLAETQNVIDKTLEYLERNLSKRASVRWSGESHLLTFGKHGQREGALALLHMITERWLPIFDALAARSQLERLMHVIMRTGLPPTPEASSASELRASSLLLQAFRSAQFWELPNLRNAFLTYLSEATSLLDGVTFNDLQATTSAKEVVDAHQVHSTIRGFELLLLVPTEYLSRSCRMDLVKRALTADILVCRLPDDAGFTPEWICQSLTIIRVFLQRTFLYVGTSEHPTQSHSDYLEHLMESPPHTTEEYVTVTLRLIETSLIESFRAAGGGGSPILKILDSYSQSNLFTTSPTQAGAADIRRRCFIRIVELLTTEFLPTSFSDEVQTAIRTFHERLSSSLLPEMSALVAESFTTEALETQIELMSGWHCLLSLGRWLGMSCNSVPIFGRGLCSRVSASSTRFPAQELERILVTIMAILLQEFHYRATDERPSHLELVTAAYITFFRVLGSSGRKQIDEYISRACRALSASDFGHVLDLASESLLNTSNYSEDLECFVHFSVMLLREHPQGTLKGMQSFTTQCINTFASRSVFTIGSLPLRLQVLEFLVQQCSDQPAALRSVDISSIWLLLSKFLSQSKTHDEDTSTDVFHKITTVISALVRFRRDLVIHTSPHLGMVLRQLILSVRSPRPHLGTKQTALVTDSQPRWLNARSPLGADEGKALARLLGTLTTKNIARNYPLTSDNQKAESLAKPFSKHASYVLKAYIEAMNDPLCILPSELRKELEPGLYALCSMVNDHSRDAMMVSALDAGGRATMKALWKEYEKQRYVGKG